MSTALVVALIALAGSALSALVNAFGIPAQLARRNAKALFNKYREPLLASAYELQARLHNILCNTFVERYIDDGSAGKSDAAIESTLYVFAQFFGWREIIRSEVQFLRPGRVKRTRRLNDLLREIGEAILSETYGSQFMIWRVEQRGLGERMIVSGDSGKTCMGYASFIDKRDTMAEWLDPIKQDLTKIDAQGRERLTKMQHLLLDLVYELDDKHQRYPPTLAKA